MKALKTMIKLKRTMLMLLCFVLATGAAYAQRESLYSVLYHEKPGYYRNLLNTMQQRDGDFVINTYILEDTGDPDFPIPLGNMYYKISSSTPTITDSLFVADTVRQACVFARDPRGEGNIKATFEYHAECDSSFVRISHFPDDALQVDADQDIVVPVCEGQASVDFYGHLVDCHGDLIVKYFKEQPDGTYNEYVARIDREGTVERQSLLFEDSDLVARPFGVFKESPLQYYQWGPVSNELPSNLSIVVMDSLFNKNTVILNNTLSDEVVDTMGYVHHYEYLMIDYENEVIPVGGDDVLVAAEYVSDTNHNPMQAENGVAVAKYDLRTMRLKGYVVFNDYHGYYDTGQCLGLKMMSDGTVYFVYREHPDPGESVTVVKMDTDLNVEWKRLCKTDDIVAYPPFYYSVVYEDGNGEEKGIVWSGYARKTGGQRTSLVHFFLNHDGTVGVNESGIEVRPYSYYPNPTQDQLRLQYSPDVQPRQIELYDLQGRLVRTQRSGLESLSLQGLAAGQYVMKVTMEDGQTFSDKVVKE